MKKVFFLILLFKIAIGANSQIVTVKDIQTGEPLEMASLISELSKSYITTNALGQADISGFREAKNIEIRRLGYKTEIKSYAEIREKSFEILLTVSVTQFDEIVVSATRWNLNSRNIPSKITIISPKDVVLHNPQTAADLLGSSGEVFIQKSQQGGGSPMIRGFATNRLLYTIDGVRMNTAIFRAGNIQNVISLDPFSIERTEIFYGPGSVMYGSDAIGGVMSFQTLVPQFSLNEKPLITARTLGRYSSANNEISVHFDVNTGWKKWAMLTSITHSKYGNLKMGKHGPDEYLKTFYVQRVDSVDRVFENINPEEQNPTAYSQINLMQKVCYRPNSEWDLQFGFHYSETSEYSRYDRLIETQQNGLPVSAVWNYGPQIWMMNHLSVLNQGKNWLYDQMTLRLAHQYFEESRIDRRFNHYRLRSQMEKVYAYSASLDFEKSINKNKFFYGFEYVLNDVKSYGTAQDIRSGSPIPVPDRYPASQWKNYAGYLNFQLMISEEFLLQTGARYSSNTIESDFTRHLSFYPFDFTNSIIKSSSVTGSAGMVYRPGETWKIGVNAGTGFRAPNVDDTGKIFDFVDGEVVVPNTALKVEYAYNAEFGISKIVGDFMKLDFTGFYTYLDHAMVRRGFQVNGQDSILYNGQMSRVYAIQNAAYGTVYGFNAGIEVKFPLGFGFSSRFNYQLGSEEMDNGKISRSRHAAPAFGLTRLTFRQDKLMMELGVSYSARVASQNLNEEERQKPAIYAKDAEGNPYSPAWYTLNFKAMYQFHPILSISAGIENITDQRYRPYSSGLVAPGRNFVFSAKAAF